MLKVRLEEVPHIAAVLVLHLIRPHPTIFRVIALLQSCLQLIGSFDQFRVSDHLADRHVLWGFPIECNQTAAELEWEGTELINDWSHVGTVLALIVTLTPNEAPAGRFIHFGGTFKSE